MPIKWIISDVDGCITPESSAAWDYGLLGQVAALTRAAAVGESDLAPMTLCTGRPQPYTEVLMKILDVRAPAICENGAVIYTLADNHARFAPGVTEEKVLGLRALRAFLEVEVLPREPAAFLQFGKEAQMSVFSETPEIFPRIQERIDGFLAERGGPDLDISASHFYLNISLRGIDKGAAIRAVLADLGASHDEVAGIGDTEGDLPLRDAVGFFAAPANARDAVKAVADYVSPYPETQGVLDILRRPEMRRG